MAVVEQVITHSIASEFSRTPGPRYVEQGPFSGEMFRKDCLKGWLAEADHLGAKLRINLDGGYGYAPSFLEESFGGLAREVGRDRVLRRIELISDEEPLLMDSIHKYILEAESV